jgi:hypothetical protein
MKLPDWPKAEQLYVYVAVTVLVVTRKGAELPCPLPDILIRTCGADGWALCVGTRTLIVSACVTAGALVVGAVAALGAASALDDLHPLAIATTTISATVAASVLRILYLTDHDLRGIPADGGAIGFISTFASHSGMALIICPLHLRTRRHRSGNARIPLPFS